MTYRLEPFPTSLATAVSIGTEQTPVGVDGGVLTCCGGGFLPLPEEDHMVAGSVDGEGVGVAYLQRPGRDIPARSSEDEADLRDGRLPSSRGGG